MSRILLSGSTGFLGGHLLEALLKSGHEVVALKRSTSNCWRIQDFLEDVQTIDVDRRDLKSAFEDRQIDIVVHTACNYGRNKQSARELVETNVLLGLDILDSAIVGGAQTFINSGTLLPRGLNEYTVSKQSFSDWLELRSKEIRVIDFKVEQMYGPKDDDVKFVPWLIKQLEAGVERIALTDGLQKRDFVFVRDVVSAFELAVSLHESLPNHCQFDVGSGKPITVREFVEALYEEFGNKHPNANTKLGFGDIPRRSGEPESVKADISSLQALGWQPSKDLYSNLSTLFNT